MTGSSRSLVPIALVALVACQPEPPPGTATALEAKNAAFLEFKNGSRLAAKRIEVPGGEPILIGIFDTKEQVECRFLNASDNLLRCLPNIFEASYPYLFADKDCKEPVYRVPKGIDLSKGTAVAIDDLLVCETKHRYAVKLFSPFEGTLFWKDGKNCVAQVSSVSPDETLVISVGEGPPSDWVAGEEAMRQGDGRIRSNDVYSVDGGRFSMGLFDEKLGTRCRAIPKGGDTSDLICQPQLALEHFGHDFGDAYCQTMPLALNFGACESPAFVKVQGSYSSLGKPWSASVYHWNGHQCVIDESSDSWTRLKFYEIGEQIGEDPFATLEARRVGSGRLTTAFAASAGQVLGASIHFDVLDSRLGKPCRFVSSPKDGLRCLPDDMFFHLGESYFSDSSCTAAVMACDDCEGKEVAISNPHVSEQFQPTDIRRIGAEASGVYYERGYDNGKQVCKGPLDVRDWRSPKGQPIPLPHLWKIGDATSWDRFEQVFVRSQL